MLLRLALVGLLLTSVLPQHTQRLNIRQYSSYLQETGGTFVILLAWPQLTAPIIKECGLHACKTRVGLPTLGLSWAGGVDGR